MTNPDDTPDLPQDAPLRVRLWWRFWRGWRKMVTLMSLLGLIWQTNPGPNAHLNALLVEGSGFTSDWSPCPGQQRLSSIATGEGVFLLAWARNYHNALLFSCTRSADTAARLKSIGAFGYVWVLD